LVAHLYFAAVVYLSSGEPSLHVLERILALLGWHPAVVPLRELFVVFLFVTQVCGQVRQ